MFIRELLGALGGAGVRYCLVGGVAVNLHGIPRMTYDVDIVVALDAANLGNVAGVMDRLGLRRRIPVDLATLFDERARRELAERNVIALTFTDPNDPLREVDVLVNAPGDPDGIVARAIERPMGEVTVRIASLEDLIALKRAAGRDQDLADLEHLERLGSSGDV